MEVMGNALITPVLSLDCGSLVRRTSSTAICTSGGRRWGQEFVSQRRAVCRGQRAAPASGQGVGLSPLRVKFGDQYGAESICREACSAAPAGKLSVPADGGFILQS